MVTIPELPKKTESKVEEQLYKAGKFEITEEEDFKIWIYIKKTDKRWTIVKNEEICDEKHWVIFRMWTYEEEIELRKQVTNFDMMKRMHLIDNDMLDRLKLQKLIKAWSFEDDNPRLKLVHINGVLCDESYKAMMKLHPNILKHIIGKMNEILEYNG